MSALGVFHYSLAPPSTLNIIIDKFMFDFMTPVVDPTKGREFTTNLMKLKFQIPHNATSSSKVYTNIHIIHFKLI